MMCTIDNCVQVHRFRFHVRQTQSPWKEKRSALSWKEEISEEEILVMSRGIHQHFLSPIPLQPNVVAFSLSSIIAPFLSIHFIRSFFLFLIVAICNCVLFLSILQLSIYHLIFPLRSLCFSLFSYLLILFSSSHIFSIKHLLRYLFTITLYL